MQTFLPYSDFDRSAGSLDSRRLGKQRVETMQIMSALTGIKINPKTGNLVAKPSAWRRHPAVLMWCGHEDWLFDYQQAVCTEWLRRGFNDTCFDKTRRIYTYAVKHDLAAEVSFKPAWLGQKSFHRAHKSNLVRKVPEFYGDIWPNVPHDLPYIWPTKED